MIPIGILDRLRAAKPKKAGSPTAQIRESSRHPFTLLDSYVPLGDANTELYRQIRESVPVIDAAIMKLIRLTGGFRVICTLPKAERELTRFLGSVGSGRGQIGIGSFLDSYIDSLLTTGRAVGEIVTVGNRDIAALLCGNPSDVHVLEGDSPLDFTLCGQSVTGKIEPFPHQELLLFTPLNPEAASPYGVSLLRSMPYLTGVLLKIFNSIGTNWERAGNLRYSVVYKPSGDVLDRTNARERSEQIAREWALAMQSSKGGAVRDFVAVGDVDIKVIGSDAPLLDSDTPVRQILEQLIAKTGIPPFMLGLSWSSTERMSAQQADLMTSELTSLRRTLNPVIERIAELWLRMHGYACGFRVEWDPINLQDSVEEARAELYMAQAENAREKISGRNNEGSNAKHENN